MNNRLNGRIALVTGASRGIGRAIAIELGNRGATVIVNYRRDADAARVTADQVTASGGVAHVIQADLGDQAQIDAMFDEVTERFGALDVMVLNAGATAFKDLVDVNDANVTKTLAISVNGSIRAAQRARPLMAGREASIVTISSMDSIRHVPRHALLGIAKAGMDALVRFMAVDFAKDGIVCNGVMPGPVLTESLDVVLRSRGEEYLPALRDRIRRTPLGRFARPEDIAKVVAMLCQPDARWITGQIIVADGGFLLTVDELGVDTTSGEQELMTEVG